MKPSRWTLLGVSIAIVLMLGGGTLAVKLGAAEGTYGEIVVFSEVLSLVRDNYVDPVETERLLEGAYEGMLADLEPNATFLTAEEVDAWQAATGPGTADPGFDALKVHGALQVVYVAPGSPADQTDIRPGDQIRQIAGRPVRHLAMEQALRMLSGEPGSRVEVELLRGHGDFERERITLERAERDLAAHELELVDGTALLTVRDLGRLQPDEIRAELGSMTERGIERLLIDLRNVMRGSPADGIRVASLFGEGLGLRLRNHDGEQLEQLAAPGETRPAWTAELAVLVNGATSGGAEALAELLKGAGHRVFGETTFGLGGSTGIIKLADGSGLLLSTGIWETIDGARWNESGVDPDTVVRAIDPSSRGEDQLRRTLEILSGDAESDRQAA